MADSVAGGANVSVFATRTVFSIVKIMIDYHCTTERLSK